MLYKILTGIGIFVMINMPVPETETQVIFSVVGFILIFWGFVQGIRKEYFQ